MIRAWGDQSLAEGGDQHFQGQSKDKFKGQIIFQGDDQSQGKVQCSDPANFLIKTRCTQVELNTERLREQCPARAYSLIYL